MNNIKKYQEKQPASINEHVKRYLRCIKSLNVAYSTTPKQEMAEVCNVSKMYLPRHTEDIEAYLTTAPEATDDDMQWFNDRSINQALNNCADTREYLGVITGHILKYKYEKLGHIRKASKIKDTGMNVMKIVSAIKARKHTKGTPIHANSTAVRSLTQHNKVAWIDDLFSRTGGYYSGHTSKLWRTTMLMDKVLEESISIFLDKIAIMECRNNVLSSHLCGVNWTTYSSKCCSLTATPLKWYTTPLYVSVKFVSQLSLTSLLHIIQHTIGFEHGHFIVNLNHTSKTDPRLGRNYNVFTRLRSHERKVLGFKNYDMSCALQTISLQLTQASKSNYPLLTHYSREKSFKRHVRATIAKDLDVPVSDVKQKLTSFANGAVSGIDKHPLYKEFQEESDHLRREVLSHVAKYNPGLLEQAIRQSKKHLPEDIDWFSIRAEDQQSLARSKSSVFFFIWTHYERLIRRSMLTVLTDGIEVHDAVYSRMDVSTEILEAVILESTGFQIQIEID